MNDLDGMLDFLINTIEELSNVNMPLTRCSRKKFKDKSWINNELKKKIKHKNSLFFKAKQSSKEEDMKLYKAYKKDLDRIIKNTQIEYYKNLLDSRKNSIKNIWKTLNNICSFKKSVVTPKLVM